MDLFNQAYAPYQGMQQSYMDMGFGNYNAYPFDYSQANF